MLDNFKPCLAFTLVQEGGYADNPADPGGATMRGITQITFDEYRRSIGQPLYPVRGITYEEVETIYRNLYWDRARCAQFPVGSDLCIFDYAVNSGVGAVVRFALNAGIDEICEQRLAFLRGLSTWRDFGDDWSARVARCRARAKEMAGGVPSA